MKRALVILTLATVSLWAGPQDIQFPANFDKLAEKAEEVVDTAEEAVADAAEAVEEEAEAVEEEAK